MKFSPSCGYIRSEVSDARMHATLPDHKLTALGWSLSLPIIVFHKADDSCFDGDTIRITLLKASRCGFQASHIIKKSAFFMQDKFAIFLLPPLPLPFHPFVSPTSLVITIGGRGTRDEHCRRREVEAGGGSRGWMLALLGTRWHCAVSAEELGIWLIIS